MILLSRGINVILIQKNLKIHMRISKYYQKQIFLISKMRDNVVILVLICIQSLQKEKVPLFYVLICFL